MTKSDKRLCQNCGRVYLRGLSLACAPGAFCGMACETEHGLSGRTLLVSEEIPLGEPQVCTLGGIPQGAFDVFYKYALTRAAAPIPEPLPENRR